MISSIQIKRMAKEQGKRLSKNALELLTNSILEEISDSIKKAATIADFSGRKTIKSDDIKSVFNKKGRQSEF